MHNVIYRAESLHMSYCTSTHAHACVQKKVSALSHLVCLGNVHPWYAGKRVLPNVCGRWSTPRTGPARSAYDIPTQQKQRNWKRVCVFFYILDKFIGHCALLHTYTHACAQTDPVSKKKYHATNNIYDLALSLPVTGAMNNIPLSINLYVCIYVCMCAQLTCALWYPTKWHSHHICYAYNRYRYHKRERAACVLHVICCCATALVCILCEEFEQNKRSSCHQKHWFKCNQALAHWARRPQHNRFSKSEWFVSRRRCRLGTGGWGKAYKRTLAQMPKQWHQV